jgi:hypothetical protein
MAKLGIGTGIVPDDGTGDSLLDGAVKINSNFSEIYTQFGDGTNLTSIGGTWASTSAGIHTLKNVGIGTTNPRFLLEVGAVGASGTTLFVNGDARITGIVTIGPASITLDGTTNIINVGTGITINGSTGIISATSIVLGGTTLTGAAVTSITAGSGISVDQSTGNVTITATGGGSSQWVTTAAGIHTLSNVGIGTTNPTNALTVKGNTSLETLSVSGVSTFLSGIQLGDNSGIQLGDNSSIGYTAGDISISTGASPGNEVVLYGYQGTKILSQQSAPILKAGQNVELWYQYTSGPSGSAKKLETIGAGVTVTGTTFTNQLSVSGISTLGTIRISSGIVTATSGIVTYFGDTSNAADGRWTLGANGTSDYTFTGIGFTQTTNDPILYLARGRVYEFVNNSGGSHPFQIRVSDGGGAYSNGVTNNAAASGVIRFEIPFNAPNTLYYQCTSHSGMGNTISVYPTTI